MARRTTAYERWMDDQGLPIVTGYGVRDVREVERRPWALTGGKGAFLYLAGSEGLTGMYVGEIPPRDSLKPQKHLYEELIYILQGTGASEVWLPGDEGRRAMFEWQPGSLFAVPLNCWCQLHNIGSEPAIYLAVTNAPLMLDILHNPDFVFDNDFRFTDRFTPSAEYFSAGDRHVDEARGGVWETNFIPDLVGALVDAEERKGAGVRITRFEIAGNSMVGHVAEWPVGRYHKAHHHRGGAVLLILRSAGYSLMWPLEAGARPYSRGHRDRVVRIDWQEGAVLSPPTKWFHQHFNTGDRPAKQLAFRFGSWRYPIGLTYDTRRTDGRPGTMVSIREGGTLVDYEDEDPEIRQDFAADLARNGIPLDMPAFTYRAGDVASGD